MRWTLTQSKHNKNNDNFSWHIHFISTFFFLRILQKYIQLGYTLLQNKKNSFPLELIRIIYDKINQNYCHPSLQNLFIWYCVGYIVDEFTWYANALPTFIESFIKNYESINWPIKCEKQKSLYFGINNNHFHLIILLNLPFCNLLHYYIIFIILWWIYFNLIFSIRFNNLIKF